MDTVWQGRKRGRKEGREEGRKGRGKEGKEGRRKGWREGGRKERRKEGRKEGNLSYLLIFLRMLTYYEDVRLISEVPSRCDFITWVNAYTIWNKNYFILTHFFNLLLAGLMKQSWWVMFRHTGSTFLASLQYNSSLVRYRGFGQEQSRWKERAFPQVTHDYDAV